MASGEWVFFVDADERATPELAQEVRLAVGQAGFDGWWVPRKNYIFGAWIRHAGWYPDHQLRLLRRAKARYDERREVHELVELDGEAGYLRSHLIHYNYSTVGEFRRKQGSYTDYEARMLLDAGQRAKPWNFLLQPLRQFWWRYVTLQGYKDGWRGLLLSVLMAYYELVRYWRLWRLQRTP
jgi:(heptosyl)LPS beta-1,4-glucosyltransferase